MVENTFDSLLDSLTLIAKKQGVVDAQTYMQIAEKISVLLQEEQEKLIDMEFDLACARKMLLDEGKTAVETKMRIEASPLYRDARKQKSRIDRAIETIRLAKSHAKLTSDLMRSNM
jgi:hypothetical protein